MDFKFSGASSTKPLPKVTSGLEPLAPISEGNFRRKSYMEKSSNSESSSTILKMAKTIVVSKMDKSTSQKSSEKQLLGTNTVKIKTGKRKMFMTLGSLNNEDGIGRLDEALKEIQRRVNADNSANSSK